MQREAAGLEKVVRGRSGNIFIILIILFIFIFIILIIFIIIFIIFIIFFIIFLIIIFIIIIVILEGFGRPGEEPVDCCAIYKAREYSN